MNNKNNDPSGNEPELPAVDVDPGILDLYVGSYRVTEYTSITVSRQGGKLYVQSGNWPALEIIATSETEFTGSISKAQYTFLTDAQGCVTGVTICTDGSDIAASRIDAAGVEQIKARLAARIRGNQPISGSEAALRRLIDGLRMGAPNYEEMNPSLALLIRKQLPRLQMIATHLGAILAIEFKGVGKQGWDFFEVRRENGVAQWRIALTDGIITGAMGSLVDGP